MELRYIRRLAVIANYINIGLITDDCSIKKSIISFLNELNEFSCTKVVFPKNSNYDEWTSIDEQNCSIREMIDTCYRYEMAYFIGNFKLGEEYLNDVDFSIEKSKDNRACFVIKIPSDSFSKDIDEVELDIVKLLTNIKEFKCAFCDSEAHIDDRDYSIYVQYSNEALFTYNDWKIDGFTER